MKTLAKAIETKHVDTQRYSFQPCLSGVAT